MGNQTVEIADLIKPKFQPGELVYLVRTDTHGVEAVLRVLINEVRYVVSFKRTSGPPYRSANLAYDLLNNGSVSEDRLFKTLDDVARNAK